MMLRNTSGRRRRWRLIWKDALKMLTDAAFIAKALGDIARAKRMAQVARDAELSRESLCKALSGDRSPGFDTILKGIEALGLRLHAEASQG
jgi:probable addiction module antidote protein